MTRLILHIGMHKTGSTSVQAALHAAAPGNRQTLAIGMANHSIACRVMFDDWAGSKRFLSNNGISEEDANAMRARLLAEIDSQLGRKDRAQFVLSSEWLSSAPEHSVQRLRDWCAPRFEKVDIYAYVRPPASFMASNYQQVVRLSHGNFRLLWPHYRRRFRKFEKLFGKPALNLRLFDKTRLEGGDVVADFASWTGVACPHRPKAEMNASASAAALALIACYRRHRPDAGSPAINTELAGLIRFAERLPSPKFALAQPLLEAKLEANREDIAWIEKRLGEALREPEAGHLATDRYRIGSEADLKRAAAHFSPLLHGAAPEEPPEDPDEADALAWRRMVAWLERPGIGRVQGLFRRVLHKLPLERR